MTNQDIMNYCIDTLKGVGADKGSCSLNVSEKKELNVEVGEMTLFRTTFNTNLGISLIKDQKKSSTSINKTDKESINTAIESLIEMAAASQPDEAYDISESQPTKSFIKGEMIPDLDKMYISMDEFVDYVKSKYPQIILETAILDFTNTRSYFQNTNGVSFKVNEGIYGFSPMFTSKKGKDTSSFNYTFFSALNINKPIHQYGTIDTLLRQSTEQIHTQKIKDKFIGNIIVTPDCIGDFLGFVMSDISDGKMISGNSLYKEMLNNQIASSKLSISSCPVSKEISDGYFITNDGYIADNSVIIDKGILKTHLLGLYGSKKLSKKRAVNDGGAYIVSQGDESYEKIIKNTDKGILLCRFSGGSPASNGDFSGVAKNSYYIENGEVKYPISETMISGNISEMMKNIIGISKERVDFGSGILPWISFNGITIS